MCGVILSLSVALLHISSCQNEANSHLWIVGCLLASDELEHQLRHALPPGWNRQN